LDLEEITTEFSFTLQGDYSSISFSLEQVFKEYIEKEEWLS